MDFAEWLQSFSKEAQQKVAHFADQVKDKYEDSDLDDKLASLKAEVSERYDEFADSVKGKIDESELDDKFPRTHP